MVATTVFGFVSMCGAAWPQNSFEDESERTSLSRYQVVEEGENLPTLQELEDLEDQSKALFAEGKCEEAAEVNFADAANTVSNVLRQTLEPFYSADRDDRSTIINRPANKDLVTVERTANHLIGKRNEAWFSEVKCYYQRGDKSAAVPRLYRTLDFIHPLEAQDIWIEAREMMWELIGYEP